MLSPQAQKPVLYDAHGRPFQAQASAYHAASLRDRALASWNPPAGSPDADILPELGTLRTRSRDLVRNHGVAGGAVQTMLDSVVGGGLRLSAKPDYRALGRDINWARDWSRGVEAKFREWAESINCDAARMLTFAGLTSLAFRALMVDGEALALPLWLPGREGARYATCLQIIEADRLSNPQDRPDSDTLRGGVEIDEYGAPVAYWVRKYHPGDDYLGGVVGLWSTVQGLPTMPGGAYLGMENGLVTYEWERIPARTEWGRRRVIHVFDKQRAGQNRGVPHLASVMRQFKMLEHYQKTELTAAIVNAMIALFIETPLDPTSLEQLFTIEAGASGDLQSVFNQRLNAARAPLRAGGIYPLLPGEKVTSHSPNRPSGAYAPFVNSLFDGIAVGLGMSPEMFTKNFRESNYSSARMALLETWRFFLGRRQFLATYWCDPVKDLWLEEAVNLGELEAPDFYQNRYAYSRAQWIGPGKGWVDPVKEPQGARLRLEGLLSTLETECAEQGRDYEEVLDQIAFEREMMAERGLAGPAADSQSWLTGNEAKAKDKEETT